MWYVDTLEDLFSPEDASLIMHIPHSTRMASDKIICNSSPLGVFTVRSAYYVARDVLGKPVPSIASRCIGRRLLWSSRVIPKIKFHMWRLFHDFLPLNASLHGRGIPIEVSRPVCGLPDESSYQLFFDCSVSRVVWHDLRPRMWGSMDLVRCLGGTYVCD